MRLLFWVLKAAFLLVLASVGDASHNVTSRRLSSSATNPPLGMVVVPSTKSFEDTYNDLVEILENNPNINIFARMDHAPSTTWNLPNNKVVIFGNPALGSPVMLENQLVGLDLPQKMLVWQEEDGGPTFLGYNSVDYLIARHDDPPIAGTPQLDTISGALANIASGATGVVVSEIQQLAALSEEDAWYLEDEHTTRSRCSDFDYETTYQRLVDAISTTRTTATVGLDHAAGASTVGINLRPTIVSFYGDAALEKSLVRAAPSVGIDLPLKALVWEKADGTVWVTTNAPYFLMERHPGMENAGSRVMRALRKETFRILRAATKEDDRRRSSSDDKRR